MSRKQNVSRIGLSALAVSVCVAIGGCGGGGAAVPDASGASGGGGGSASRAAAAENPTCVSFGKAYKAFLGGATPMNESGNTWDELNAALGKIVGPSIPSDGIGLDMFNLANDAVSASDDLSQSEDITGDVSRFNADLAKIGKDCGATFTPATTSS
jgi:hypothetical protein